VNEKITTPDSVTIPEPEPIIIHGLNDINPNAMIESITWRELKRKLGG